MRNPGGTVRKRRREDDEEDKDLVLYPVHSFSALKGKEEERREERKEGRMRGMKKMKILCAQFTPFLQRKGKRERGERRGKREG